MRLRIQGRGFCLTDGLRAHVERRLAFALGPHRGQVRSVTVLLDDVNGPRGGVDKRCRIFVQLDASRDVRLAQLDPSLYAAIDRAADRARRAVARKLARRRRVSHAPWAPERQPLPS